MAFKDKETERAYEERRKNDPARIAYKIAYEKKRCQDPARKEYCRKIDWTRNHLNENRRAKNKLTSDKRNHEAILAKVKITEEQYQELLRESGNLCLICRQPPVKRKLAIDHSHKTGKVRGLLCMNCNVAIGFLMDNPVLCRRAAEYLEQRGT